jgi:MarR family transcriptional regulator for hemolysin
MTETGVSAAEIFSLLRRSFLASTKAGIMQKQDAGGLTYLQRNVLLHIARQGKCIQRELAAELCLAMPAVTRLVESLTRKKIVVTAGDPADRRKKAVSLTPEGYALLGLVDEYPVKQVAALLEKLSPQEQRALAEGLRLLVQSLETVSS